MRKVLVGGLAGAIVLLAWLFVADGILGFRRAIEMKSLGEERMVYAFLVQQVTEPGRYVCNPELLPERRFPGKAPIFAIQYSGLGHDNAGQEVIVGVMTAILACLAGAWLVAQASSVKLSRYRARVLFLAMVGVVVVLLEVMGRFSISGYSLVDAIALGLHDFAGWVLAGLVMARIVSPGGEQVTRTAV